MHCRADRHVLSRTRKLGAAGEEARGGSQGRARRVAGVQKSKVQKSWLPGVSQSQGVEPAVDKRRGGGVWLGVSVLEAKMSQLWSR